MSKPAKGYKLSLLEVVIMFLKCGTGYIIALEVLTATNELSPLNGSFSNTTHSDRCSSIHIKVRKCREKESESSIGGKYALRSRSTVSLTEPSDNIANKSEGIAAIGSLPT